MVGACYAASQRHGLYLSGTWCDSEKIKNIILHLLFSARDTLTELRRFLLFSKSKLRATPNQWLLLQCSGIVMMSASSHELVRFSVTAAKEVWRLHINAWHSFSKNKHQQPYKHLTGTGGKSRNSAFVDKVSAYDVFDPEKWPCSR